MSPNMRSDGLDSPDRLGAPGEWTKLPCRFAASHTTCTGRSTETANRSIHYCAATARRYPRKVFSGGGLYTYLMPSGGRYWRYKYRYGGRGEDALAGYLSRCDR